MSKMMTIPRFVSVVAAAAILTLCVPVFGGAWKAGAAKVMITPQQKMWMSGYASRDKPAEGKLTELWAKAVVLEDEKEGRALLVTLDLLGIDGALSNSVRDALAELGFDRSRIAICCSHTHTGPIVAGNLRAMHYELLDDVQKTLVAKYAEFLEQKIVDAAKAAIAEMAPCRLSWGSGVATFAVNRRNNRPESDVPKVRLAQKLQGPFDHDVPVLAVHDEKDQLKAVVFGYACHSTVLSFYQWSGDYGGFAQMELEENHPGCVALFWAGCGGDQNPLPRRTVELARHYGRRLATAVDSVLLTSQMTPLNATLRTSYEEIDLPLDTLPTREDLVKDTSSKNRYIASRAKMLLAQVDGGEPLSQTYPYPIQMWELGGDIQFVTLGGEVVVDYAVRIKAELGDKKTWVAGYSNDVMAYIPSRRVLTEGGYEGGGAMIYYGLPTIWAPEVEQLIMQEVHRQAKLKK